MTFREKLAQEHPEEVSDKWPGGCYGCPYEYGYELLLERPCSGEFATIGCRACWDREITLTPEEQEEHDLEINAEILRAYCTHECGSCPADGPCCQMSGLAWLRMPYNAEKQRAMLDAFEAALPPEEDVTHPVRRRIPESVRDLIDSRIISIDNQIKFLQAERQELIDFWNGKDMEK